MNYRIFFFSIFVFVISSNFIFAQNKRKFEINTNEQYDSLVYKALAMFQEPRTRYNLDAIPTDKCGLRIQAEIHSRRNELSQRDKDILSAIFSKEAIDANVVSPNGNFRIHYNITGPDAPDLTDDDQNGIPDFVDSVAYYFEYSLDILLEVLGVEINLKELSDSGEEYDIYIENLAPREYGYTDFNRLLFQDGELERYSSSITIDNDFSTVYTRGIDGMKVTAIHELFHVIQIGKFGIWDWRNDIYFYEILSTWAETFGFPDIKDYYQFLDDFFSSTNRPFWLKLQNGYDLGIFGIFLEQRFSANIMRTVLESVTKYRPMQAIDVALRQYSSSFSKEFAEFSNWVFFTGYRAIDNAYFKNAKEYPVLFGNSVRRVQYNNLPVDNISTSLRSYSTQYYEFVKGSDTINIISVYTNDEDAFEYNNNKYSSSVFQISSESNDGRAVSLMDDLQVLFTSDLPANWKNFYLINHQYYNTITDDIKAFPNPLYLTNGNTGKMNFNIPVKVGDEAELFVFSSDLRLIYQAKQNVKSVFMKPGIEWNCVDIDNKIISSGIYFYVIKTNGKEWKNKFAVIKKK